MVVEVVWVVLGIIFMAPEAVSVVLEVVWVVLGMVTVVLGVVVMVLRVVARVRKVFFRRHEDGEEEGGCAFYSYYKHCCSGPPEPCSRPLTHMGGRVHSVESGPSRLPPPRSIQRSLDAPRELRREHAAQLICSPAFIIGLLGLLVWLFPLGLIVVLILLGLPAWLSSPGSHQLTTERVLLRLHFFPGHEIAST